MPSLAKFQVNWDNSQINLKIACCCSLDLEAPSRPFGDDSIYWPAFQSCHIEVVIIHPHECYIHIHTILRTMHWLQYITTHVHQYMYIIYVCIIVHTHICMYKCYKCIYTCNILIWYGMIWHYPRIPSDLPFCQTFTLQTSFGNRELQQKPWWKCSSRECQTKDRKVTSQ